ncbi:uncharacterized protein LOC131224314 [Magnolia sinica]|uniref:uncharacterized protein LOC131224314 n=1 Tax=Magnolia sinica TaxID=86752 RepID=UPI002659FA45|nr:uncharacterized protein LOC131224314 [Magnolia sinica]
METDCYKHVRKCFECQKHANQIHTPASELYNLTIPWPFSIWGPNIIGKVNLKALNGHEYILVPVDYFTKWIEAVSYATIAASHVEDIIPLQAMRSKHTPSYRLPTVSQQAISSQE